MGNVGEIACCVERNEEDKTQIAPLDLPRGLDLNHAFIVLEPKLTTSERIKSLLRGVFADHGIAVQSVGHVTSDEILQQRVLERRFGEIAAKARVHLRCGQQE